MFDVLVTFFPLSRKCPSRSFPGVWELPLNQIVMEEFSCAMVEACTVLIIVIVMHITIIIISVAVIVIVRCHCHYIDRHGHHHFRQQVDSCPPYFSEEELTEMFMEVTPFYTLVKWFLTFTTGQ